MAMPMAVLLAALCLLGGSRLTDAQCSASAPCPLPGTSGLCCSSSGFCGGNSLTDPSDPWCGTGCNPAAGKCFGSAASSSPPPPSGGSGGGCKYTVLSGDVCCKIAWQLGTIVQTLYDLNPAIETTSFYQCTNLQPGQVLNIPCNLPGPGKSPKPETNKACSSFNCGTYYDPSGMCPKASPPPPPKAYSPPPYKAKSPPPPAICTVKFAKGDTCCSIAKAKGSCVANLVKLNPWVETFTTAKCQNVQIGDTLVVPCKPDGCAAESCSTSCLYSIKSGDTCGCIAKTLGINTATLYSMNSWISTDKPKCQNLCVKCTIKYPCKPTAAQATGTDPAAVCPPPPKPDPPCYADSCPGPDTLCVPDKTADICAKAASTFGLPGACYNIVSGLKNIPSMCPCMCAGICSGGSCGDGVCSTGAVKATCGTCKCSSPSPKAPKPPPAPPPAALPCSAAWTSSFYISNPSVTVRNGMCFKVSASNVLSFNLCSVRSKDTDLFTVGAGFPSAWFAITHVKSGLCISMSATSLKVTLAKCDSSAAQSWMYSYYLGLLQSKTGHFLGSVGDSMAVGTTFIGYPAIVQATSATATAYRQLSRSFVFWPTTTPKCGFTGAVVSLNSDDVSRPISPIKGITWPAPLGATPQVDGPALPPKNLQMCLDATTIQTYGGVVNAMVSFLPCVDGKASQYVQTVSYNSLDWSQSQIGDASFKVTNIPAGWPEGQFFITFPKFKPNLCFDVWRSMGRNVAVIAYRCHPNWLPGNQLWTIDWTRGHIRNVIPSGVDVFGGGQGTKGNPVCTHFDKITLDVFTSNCTGDSPTNKFLWKFQKANQKGGQVNSQSLMTVG